MRPLVGVRRDGGPGYLLLMIVAFAVTVMAVRVYLDWSGYPRIGGGGLHVAHMLWGGLLLVASALLLLLFVGRRALTLAALLGGVGVGLFIDEVGKFITETNDYFFAPAAPLIYGAVLLLVLLWLVLRRADGPDPAQATQGAIEAIRDLADGRLSASQRDRAAERLVASGATGGEGLPDQLLAILRSPRTTATLAGPGALEPDAAGRLARGLVPDRLERILIRVGLAVWVLGAIVGLLVAVAFATGELTTLTERAGGPMEFPEEPVWVLLLAAVWVAVGVGSGAALVLSLTGRHAQGMAVAQYAVLLGLVAGGLLNTYVSQLGALSGVLVQLMLLLLILDQRARIRSRTPPAG